MYSALPSTLDLLSSRRTERPTCRVPGSLPSVFGGGSIIFAMLSPAHAEHGRAPSRVYRTRCHEDPLSAPAHRLLHLRLWKMPPAWDGRYSAPLRPLRCASGARLLRSRRHELRG